MLFFQYQNVGIVVSDDREMLPSLAQVNVARFYRYGEDVSGISGPHYANAKFHMYLVVL